MMKALNSSMVKQNGITPRNTMPIVIPLSLPIV